MYSLIKDIKNYIKKRTVQTSAYAITKVEFINNAFEIIMFKCILNTDLFKENSKINQSNEITEKR